MRYKWLRHDKCGGRDKTELDEASNGETRELNTGNEYKQLLCTRWVEMQRGIGYWCK